ncbi:MAG: zeta toxin family protein [Bacteroidia bacterium]|nr:zeta toxin family protein [Bacteroidia bacterium]
MNSLTRTDAEKLYETYRTQFFNHITKDNNPMAVILGGQPASGKSSLVSRVLADNFDKTFLKVNGDIYRAYHPDYEKLIHIPDRYT